MPPLPAEEPGSGAVPTRFLLASNIGALGLGLGADLFVVLELDVGGRFTDPKDKPELDVSGLFSSFREGPTPGPTTLLTCSGSCSDRIPERPGLDALCLRLRLRPRLGNKRGPSRSLILPVKAGASRIVPF